MTEREDQFEALFAAHHEKVLAFFLRRTDQPADAADLVGETFLIAWRRMEEVRDRADLWLFGVARRVLANHRRGRSRQTHLADRLREALHSSPPAVEESIGLVAAELARLSPSDRELLTLTAWEGLRPADLAVVLGTSEVTARVRLHRARNRLRARLEAEALVPGALSASP